MACQVIPLESSINSSNCQEPQVNQGIRIKHFRVMLISNTVKVWRSGILSQIRLSVCWWHRCYSVLHSYYVWRHLVSQGNISCCCLRRGSINVSPISPRLGDAPKWTGQQYHHQKKCDDPHIFLHEEKILRS